METRRDVPDLDIEGDIRARREGQGSLPDDDRAKLGGPLSPRCPPEGGVPVSGIHHERHDPFEGKTDLLFPQTVPPAGKSPSGHGKFDLKPEETREPPVVAGKETQCDSAPGEGVMHAHIMKDDYFDVSENRSALPGTDVHGKDESSGVITDDKHRPEEHEGRSGEGGGIIDVNSLKDDYIDLSEDRSTLPEADVLGKHKSYGVIPKEEHPSEETTGRSDGGGGGGILDVNSLKDDYVDLSEDRIALSDAHGKHEIYGTMREEEPLPKETKDQSPHAKEEGTEDVLPLKDGQGDLSGDSSAFSGTDAHGRDERCGALQEKEELTPKETQVQSAGGGGIIDVHDLKDDYVGLSVGLQEPNEHDCSSDDVKNQDTAKLTPQVITSVTPDQSEAAAIHLPTADLEGSQNLEEAKDEGTAQLTSQSRPPADEPTQHDSLEGHSPVVDREQSQDPGDSKHEDTAQLTSQIKSPADEPRQEEAREIHSPDMSPKHLPQTAPQNDDDLKIDGSQHDDSSLKVEKQEETAQFASVINPPMDELEEQHSPHGNHPVIDPQPSERVLPGEEDTKHPEGQPNLESSNYDNEGLKDNGRREVVKGGTFNRDADTECSGSLLATVNGSSDATRDLQAESTATKQDDKGFPEEGVGVQDGNDVDRPESKVPDPTYVMGGRPECGIVVPDDGGRNAQENNEETSGDGFVQDAPRDTLISDGKHDYNPPLNVDFSDDGELSHPVNREGLGSDSPLVNLSGDEPEVSQAVPISEGEPERKPSSYGSEEACDTEQTQSASEQVHVSRTIPGDTFNEDLKNDKQTAEQEAYQPEQALNVEPDDIRATDAHKSEEAEEEISPQVGMKEVNVGRDEDVSSEKSVDTARRIADIREDVDDKICEEKNNDIPLDKNVGESTVLDQQIEGEEGRREVSTFVDEDRGDVTTIPDEQAEDLRHVIPQADDKIDVEDEARNAEEKRESGSADVEGKDVHRGTDEQSQVEPQLVNYETARQGEDENVEVEDDRGDNAKQAVPIPDDKKAVRPEEQNPEMESPITDTNTAIAPEATSKGQVKPEAEETDISSHTANAPEGSAEEQMKPGAEETEINRVVPDGALTEGMKSQQSAVEPQIVNYEAVGQGEEENVKLEGDSGDKYKEAVPILDNDLAIKPDEQNSKLEAPIIDSDAPNPPEASAKDQISRGAEEAEISGAVPDDALSEGRKSAEQTTEQQIPVPEQVPKVEYGDVHATDGSKSEVVDKDVVPPYVTKETDERRDGASLSETTEECAEARKTEQSAVEPQIANYEVVGQGEEENVKVEGDYGDEDKEAVPILDNDLPIRPDEQNPKLEAPITDSDASYPPEASAKDQISRGAEEAEISFAVPDDALSEGRKSDEQTTEQQIPFPEQVHRVEYGDVQATDRSKSEVVVEDVVPPYVTKETDERRDGASLSETTEECTEVRKGVGEEKSEETSNATALDKNVKDDSPLDGQSEGAEERGEVTAPLNEDIRDVASLDEKPEQVEDKVDVEDEARNAEATREIAGAEVVEQKDDIGGGGDAQSALELNIVDHDIMDLPEEQNVEVKGDSGDGGKPCALEEPMMDDSTANILQDVGGVKKSGAEDSNAAGAISDDKLTTGMKSDDHTTWQETNRPERVLNVQHGDVQTTCNSEAAEEETDERREDAALSQKSVDVREGICAEKDEEPSDAIPLDKNIGDEALLDEGRKREEEREEIGASLDESRRDGASFDEEAKDLGHGPPQVDDKAEEGEIRAKGLDDVMERKNVGQSTDEQPALEPHVVNYDNTRDLPEEQNIEVKGDSGDGDKQSVIETAIVDENPDGFPEETIGEDQISLEPPIFNDDNTKDLPEGQNTEVKGDSGDRGKQPVIETAIIDENTDGIPKETVGKKQLKSDAEEGDVTETIPCDKREKQTGTQEICEPEQVPEHGEVQARETGTSIEGDEDLPEEGRKATGETRGDAALGQEGVDMVDGSGSEVVSDASPLDKRTRDVAPLDDEHSEGAKYRSEATFPPHEDRRNVGGVDEQAKDLTRGPAEVAEKTGGEEVRETSVAEVDEQETGGRGADEHYASEPQSRNYDIIDRPERELQVKSESGDAKMKDGSRDGDVVVARPEDCRPESPGARDEEPVPKFQGRRDTELREVVEQEEERKQTDEHPLEKPSQEEGEVEEEAPLTALQRYVDSMTADEEDEGAALKEGEGAGVHAMGIRGKEDGGQKQPGAGGYEEEGPKEGPSPPPEDPNSKTTSLGERSSSRDLAGPPPPDAARERQPPPKKGVFQRLKEKLSPTYHSQ